MAAAIKRVRVSLPTTWMRATSVLLVLHALDLPRHRAVVVRVFAGDEREASLLGSTVRLAEGMDARGRWSRARVNVPIGPALARVLAKTPEQPEIDVLLVPVDGKGRYLDDLDWSVGGVAIELR